MNDYLERVVDRGDGKASMFIKDKEYGELSRQYVFFKMCLAAWQRKNRNGLFRAQMEDHKIETGTDLSDKVAILETKLAQRTKELLQAWEKKKLVQN